MFEPWVMNVVGAIALGVGVGIGWLAYMLALAFGWVGRWQRQFAEHDDAIKRCNRELDARIKNVCRQPVPVPQYDPPTAGELGL